MKEGISVGIDVATQNVRVVCVDAEGTVRARSAVALLPPFRPAPDRVEQDARGWWPAVAQALRRATGSLGADRRRIVAVAAATTSGTVVLADARGEPLGAALAYDDARAAVEAARAQELGRERWESMGLQIGPSFSIAKLGWLAARDGALAGVAHAWSSADLVVSKLLGHPGPTDWSHALKGGYDLVRGEWPLEVYEALGVPASVLPAVQPPASRAGRVCAAAVEETGLPEGCEIRLGMTDGCAAQLAAGAVSPGRFVGVLGTTLVIKGASTILVRDPAGAVYSHLHPDGWWLPGGASNTGGEALARFQDGDLADLDRRADAHGPAHCVSYPLTRTGERFPFLEPRAEGFMLGKPSDEIEAYRAALEGVAFVERLGYERLGALGAPAEGAVATAGAASRSAVWNRIRATVLDRPVVVPATPTSAFGAALLGAAETLHPDLATAVRTMVSHVAEMDPDERQREALAASYTRFASELEQRGWVAPLQTGLVR